MMLSQRDRKHIWHPCTQMKDFETSPVIAAERGEGSWIIDAEGKRYLDAASSWWCNLLGHCNPKINAAVAAQLEKLEHVIFANFTHRPAVELSERLAEIVPKGLTKFFFTDNGSAAIEAAMKMSFQYHLQTGHPEKRKFIALSGAYHGETIGALSVCGCDDYSDLFRPILLQVERVPAPDCRNCKWHRAASSCEAECFVECEKVLQLHGKEAAAFLVEPLVQAAAGMNIYPPVYLKKLRSACDACGAHLIADEIATGFGRTGRMFACDFAGITPDLMCISKGLTGGYLPLAIVCAPQKIYDAFYADYTAGRAFLHSHTYCGNPLACAAAAEVMRIMQEENILETAQSSAAFFRERIREQFAGNAHVKGLRSQGLINAWELTDDSGTPYPRSARAGYRVSCAALRRGVMLRPLGDTLYFNPPLNIKADEMEFAVRETAAAMKEVLEK